MQYKVAGLHACRGKAPLFCFCVCMCTCACVCKHIYCWQEVKAGARRKSLMLKALKTLKAERVNNEGLVSIPQAVCMVASGMKVRIALPPTIHIIHA